MNSPFSDISEIKPRDLIAEAIDLVRENAWAFLKYSFLILFPISFFITASENIYENIVSSGFIENLAHLAETPSDIEIKALFNIDYILILLFAKNLLQGLFYGLGAYIISKYLLPSRLKNKTSPGEPKENDDATKSNKTSRLIIYAIISYLPIAAVSFLVEAYNLYAAQNNAIETMAFLLQLAYLLVFILYIPMVAVTYPFISEEHGGFMASVKKGFNYYKSNVYHLCGGVIIGYLIIILLTIGISATLEFITVLLNEFILVNQFNNEAAYRLFWVNSLKVLVTSLVLMISTVVPLIGYSFYSLLHTSDNKINIDTAFTDLKSRFAASNQKQGMRI